MLVCAVIAVPTGTVSGSGFSTVTITTDKSSYYAGETIHLTVEGTDSDSNPNDNYIDVYVYVVNTTSYMEIFSDTGIRVARVWNQNIEIPYSANGTGYIYVLDTNTSNMLGFKTFSVAGGGVVSGALTLQQSIYTKSLTFVPGETLRISIHDCTPLGNYTLKIMLGTNVKYERNLTVDANGNYFLNYTIPENAPDSPRPDGTRYSVELYNGTTRIDRIRYDVRLYEIYAASSRNVYIPGEVVLIKYAVLYLKNSTPVAEDLFGTWYVLTPSGTALQQPSTFRKSIGEFSFKLGNAADLGYYNVVTYYNDSATVTEPDRWDMTTTSIYCGNLGVYIYSPINGGFAEAGEIVTLSLKTFVARSGTGTDMGNLPEVGIKLNIKKGDDTVLTKNFVTDYGGYMTYNWPIPETMTEGTILEFNITASKEDAVVSKSVAITVTKSTVQGINAVLEFNRQSYLTGENISLHVAATYRDGSSGNFSYVYRVYRDAAGTNLLAMSASRSPDFIYTPPANFYGTLWYYVQIADDMGNSTLVTKSVGVDYAVILLSADRTLYLPGETLVFSYEVLSNMMKNPECFVTVTDNYGRDIMNKRVVNGSFEIQIPQYPADQYTIRIVAQENGFTATDYLTITRFSGYEFTVSLSASAYTTNVYRPGETIFITYNLKPKENVSMPQSIKISVGVYTTQSDAKIIETQEMSGIIAYTLPSNLERGTYMLLVTCQVNSTYSGTLYSWTTVSVTKDPSAADLNLGGLRAMDWILLILVILTLVLTVVFFILLYRRLSLANYRQEQKPPQSPQSQQTPQNPGQQQNPPRA
ncbi:MAG: hypothetical protein N3F63_00745 [Thermoplasmata archaeon]|nr:hypothetical protein [Thermoplasmata archaeon]